MDASSGGDPPGPGDGGAPGRGRELRAAMRMARIEDAERTRAIEDIRQTEIARLDLLREAIEPVLAAIPGDVEMFDAGLVPVPRPRLFIDMVAFVEMARDKRRYRFVQDTRQGRVLLAESASLDAMRAAVTSYIGRRLVEREKAMAGGERAMLEPRPVGWPWRLPPGWDWLRAPAAVALNYLGIVALVALVWVMGRGLYRLLAGIGR